MTIADSIAYPFESDSKYPYTPDGNREFLDGKEIVEAFVLAGALCAVTTTLRFDMFVLKLPIRPPALVAKQAGSLAAMFDNRLGLGVGTSPWPEDYELMDVPFAKRGKRMDECIDIIKGLTTGEYFEFHGEFYDIPKTKMSPGARPSRSRSSSAATRTSRCVAQRATTAGCTAAATSAIRGTRPTTSTGSTSFARKRAGQARSRSTPMSLDAYKPDGIKRLEDRGVTNIMVGFRMPYIVGPDPEPLENKIRSIEKYAEKVISKV